LERFGLVDSDVYRCSEGNDDLPGNSKLIYELDKWILALVKSGIDVDSAVKRFIAGNRDAIVICNDISCGVVPVDAVQRAWREAVGRALAALAHESDEVVRLFCGIPTRMAAKRPVQGGKIGLEFPASP
jgi:hypothetical protein